MAPEGVPPDPEVGELALDPDESPSTRGPGGLLPEDPSVEDEALGPPCIDEEGSQPNEDTVPGFDREEESPPVEGATPG